jgi:hypothetical protein
VESNEPLLCSISGRFEGWAGVALEHPIRVDLRAGPEDFGDARFAVFQVGSTWRFDELTPGEWILFATSLESPALGGELTVVVPPESELTDLRLSLGRTALVGVVLDQFGAPVEGALVRVEREVELSPPAVLVSGYDIWGTLAWTEDWPPASIPWGDSSFVGISAPIAAQRRTAADGLYELPVVPGGEWKLKATATGHLETEVWIGPVLAGERRWVELELEREVALVGVARDPGGSPWEGVSVFVRTEHEELGVDTGADGRFRFDGLRPAAAQLYLCAGGEEWHDFSAFRSLELPATGGEVAVDVQLARSFEILGVALDAGGAPLVQTSVQAVAVDSPTVIRGATTGADGSFRIGGLYEGEYQLSVPGAVQSSLTRVGPDWPAPWVELRAEGSNER